jgi:hypothetical protein
MAKFVSPQLGYNNNVRHRGRVFHIQTEDSGVSHPHVITHLFMDGGRILKSVKKSYAEHVGSETLKETVKSLMKEQHKAMFIALRDGQFDELVEGKKPSDASVKKVTVPESAPAAVIPEAAPTKPDLEAPPSSEEPSPNTIDESHRAPPVVVEPFAREVQNAPVTLPETPHVVTIPPPTITERRPEDESSERRPATELTLDFDALERDSGASPLFNSNDLPPPPANLFAKERGTGAYSTVEVEPHHQREDTRARPAPQRPSVPAPRMPSRPPPSRTGENGRYAATRPATIFGSTIKPPTPSSSIFGDELVSDKSLDEVILSYLAEDLEPRK